MEKIERREKGKGKRKKEKGKFKSLICNFPLVIFLLFFLTFCLNAALLNAKEPQIMSISMTDAVENAIKNSPKLKSLGMELEASKYAADSQRSLLYPRFFIDGTFRYVTEVPSLEIPIPGFSGKKLGDNINYSIGPAVIWTLWDKSSTRKNWLGALEQKKSKENEIKAVKKQITLATRIAYFQVQLALEQVRMIGDYLKLSQAQYKDINLSYEAGAKSKIDEMMANQEVLAKRKLLRQARADLASALRDLLALTGEEKGIDISLPFYSGGQNDLPDGIEPPTAIINMDSIDDSIKTIKKHADSEPDMQHPAIASLENSAKSFALVSEGLKSGLWPKIQLSAKSSIDYPNGPDLSSFNQNSVNLSAAFPLFESGKTKNAAKEQSYRASAIEMRIDQSENDLTRDWDKAMDQLKGLLSQQEINSQYVKQAEDLAGIVYKSYTAGRSTFLEVQTANIQALDAKTQSLRTDIQILIQLAQLENMSK